MVTFRNNLNKICTTPLALLGQEGGGGGDREGGWAIDGCRVPAGLLLLDIVKTPQGQDGGGGRQSAAERVTVGKGRREVGGRGQGCCCCC